jgi:hypothetical protein
VRAFLLSSFHFSPTGEDVRIRESSHGIMQAQVRRRKR